MSCVKGLSVVRFRFKSESESPSAKPQARKTGSGKRETGNVLMSDAHDSRVSGAAKR